MVKILINDNLKLHHISKIKVHINNKITFERENYF